MAAGTPAVAGGATIPLVVRNNTSEVVHGIEVHATAHGATGAIIASGSSQGFHPDTVQPGQITLGFAYFEQKGLPAGTTIEYQVTSEPGPDSRVMPSVDLPITQTNQAGGYVTGVAANPTGNPVGRARVDVTCFTPQGQPTVTRGTFLTPDPIPANSTTSFQIRLGTGSCPVYLIGATGHASSS